MHIHTVLTHSWITWFDSHKWRHVALPCTINTCQRTWLEDIDRNHAGHTYKTQPPTTQVVLTLCTGSFLSIQPWLPHDPPFSSSLATRTSSRIPSISPSYPSCLPWRSSVYLSIFLFESSTMPTLWLLWEKRQERHEKTAGKWTREHMRGEESLF